MAHSGVLLLSHQPGMLSLPYVTHRMSSSFLVLTESPAVDCNLDDSIRSISVAMFISLPPITTGICAEV